MRSILPPGEKEAVWLIVSVWFAGLVIMIGGEIVFDYEGLAVGVARAALMAAVGAILSLFLWRTVITAPRPLVARISFLAVGVITAVATHTAVDLDSIKLLRELLGETPVAGRILSNDPLRGMIMLLVAESGVLLYAALHAFFGMAAVAVRSAAEARDRDRLLAEARAASTGAKLAALQQQLSPHFVFNALNALGSLVESGRASEAGLMIERLSDFLRSSLVGDGEILSTLDEELATIQAYLDIETLRFGERLCVHYDCPSELRSALVPIFLLQPFLENAIKHAVAPAMRPVSITLSARVSGEDLVLTVEDDGPGDEADLSVKPRGAGVGLQNARERLKILYGPRGTLEAASHGTGFLTGVRLPLQLSETKAFA
jgi:hypothetical protein